MQKNRSSKLLVGISILVLLIGIVSYYQHFRQPKMTRAVATTLTPSSFSSLTHIQNNDIQTSTPASKLVDAHSPIISSPQSAVSGRIAYVSNRKLYLMHVECATLPGGCWKQSVRLTEALSDPDGRYRPSWSPDGRQIAFVDLYRGSEHQMSWSQVFIINADGTERTRLTDTPLMHFQPVWSPDGRRIAFDAQDGVQVMNSDGDKLIMLASTTYGDWANSLSWSPDGNRLAISFWRNGGATFISVLDAYSSELKIGDWRQNTPSKRSLLPSNPRWVYDVVWAPNSEQIAYVCYRENENADICVMDVNSGIETRLTESMATDMNPVWSPNGKYLVFESFRDGNWEIYLGSVDSRELTNLTNSPASDRKPTWSPNGKHIAFTSNRNDVDVFDCGLSCNYEIYIMNADGSGQTRLTFSLANDTHPVWAPS